MNANQSAFPIIGSNVNDIREVEVKEPGLTKREYFAGQAIIGILYSYGGIYANGDNHKDHICKQAIEVADELLKQLNP